MYRLFNYICTLCRVLFDFFSPKTDNCPSFGFKPCRYFGITHHIPLNFRYPKFLVRFKVFLSFFPIVSVPEFAVAEYCDLLSDERDIWFAFDGLHVFSVPYSARPKFLPERQFYSCVLVADSGHIIVDLLRGLLHKRCMLFSGLKPPVMGKYHTKERLSKIVVGLIVSRFCFDVRSSGFT